METRTDRLRDSYRKMLLIRRTEERILRLYEDGQIAGTCHLCIGQEAVAVGAANAFRPGDQTVSCHRGHGHLLAMGGEPARLLGELMGREIGYCRGRGGSQHLSVPSIGFLGTNGITGGGIPIATGAALTAKMKNTGKAVICFFGDGATNQGVFHESLNMAALWALPVLYLCENNGYAMSEPLAITVAGGDLLRRASAYGIRAERVDGMDVDAIESTVRDTLQFVRSGKGPAFLEATTYRFCGHSRSDRLVYRTRDEEAMWLKRDPIVTTRAMLEWEGLANEAQDIERSVQEELDAAETACRNSPLTDSSCATQGAYADE